MKRLIIIGSARDALITRELLRRIATRREIDRIARQLGFPPQYKAKS